MRDKSGRRGEMRDENRMRTKGWEEEDMRQEEKIQLRTTETASIKHPYSTGKITHACTLRFRGITIGFEK
jgi:hypothetical protein